MNRETKNYRKHQFKKLDNGGIYNPIIILKTEGGNTFNMDISWSELKAIKELLTGKFDLWDQPNKNKDVDYNELATSWINGNISVVKEQVRDVKAFHGVLKALETMNNPYNSIESFRRLCGELE